MDGRDKDRGQHISVEGRIENLKEN